MLQEHHRDRGLGLGGLNVLHGWLVPLPVRGTYEFLPALAGGGMRMRSARTSSGDKGSLGTAGSRRLGSALTWPEPARTRQHSAGDPLTEAAAALKRFPSRRLQLVLGEAAFLGATPRNSVAMSGASRLLFDAAFWPGRAGDLRDPGHWLRAALARADISEILAFAQRLDSDRVTARAGYFAEAFGRPDIAAALADLRPRAAVRLGDPREPLHARDTRFGVRDHLGVAGA